MTSTFPSGTVKFGRVLASNIMCSGSIRAGQAGVKLGNINASNTLLAVTSYSNGVHLSEVTGTTVWVDSPLNTTALLTASNIQTNALTANSASVTGGLTVSYLVSQTSVTTNTLTASSTTTTGTQWVGGAATFQSTVNVLGSTTLQSSLSAQATNLQSLTVPGTSNLNILTANSETIGRSNITTLNAITANITTTNIGPASLSYDTSSLGFENLLVSVNNNPALRLYNSDGRAYIPNGLVTNSVKSLSGQQLVLQSGDASNTVVIAGGLNVQGSLTTVDATNLSIDNVAIILARGNTSSADADVLGNGAGIVVETPVSGFTRSILWNYNLGGSNYAPTTAGTDTTSGMAFWEVVGGDLQLTRYISNTAHIGYNFASNSYVSDGMATKVSYKFSITNSEEFLLVKTNGSNLQAGGASIGATGANVAIFDLPPPSAF